MATTPTNLPVPSESPRDLKFNAGKIDEFVTSLALQYIDRFGNAHYTIEGLRKLAEQAIAAFGWITVDSFQEGATLTLPNQILRWKLPDGDGEYYRWDGAFPKVVDQDSTPATSGGIGPGAWVSVGDAALRSMLAASNGALMVGGAILECATVALAQSIAGLTEGRKVRTYYYNVPVVTDWIFTTAQPASPTFYISAVGGYLTLMTPNFASAGISSGSYVAQTAWDNRNKITALMKDTRFSCFSFGCTGTFYALGSIVPNRSYITVNIESGVRLIGRYDDASIPGSVGTNTGGMLDFTLRANYPSDYSNTGVLYNVVVKLDGLVETEFNSSHSALHNNNCIGFYNTKNCSVVGAGGVNGSDHRGVNFDGLCDNSLIDIDFVRNTQDEPLCMNVNADTGYGCVKVGRMYDMNFGGTTNLRIGVRASTGFVDVHIGSFEWNGTIQPVLVAAYQCQEINVYCGTINGVTHGLRSYETRKASIHSGQFRNTFYLISRAGVATGVTDEIYARGCKALDSSMTTAFYAETNQDGFRSLTIEKCDFTPCPVGFLYVRGLTALGTPAVIDIKGNTSPIVSGWTATHCNTLVNSVKSGLVTSGATSFTYDFKTPDWNYGFITILVNNGSLNYPFTQSLRFRNSGTIATTNVLGAVTVTTTISGSVITFSASGGTFVSAMAHN